MSQSPLRVISSDRVRTVRIDRPSSRNAISFAVMAALEVAVTEAEQDDQRRIFVMRGAEGWFASGGDLREFSSLAGVEAAHMAERMSALLRRIEYLPVPTLAVLDGPALGGGAELALAFDIRLMVDEAYLRFPQNQLGITTGWQGTERLRRLIGHARAAEYLWTGRKIHAEEAVRSGLANARVVCDEVDSAVETLIEQLWNAGEAARATKQLLLSAGSRVGLSDGEEERTLFARLWDHPGRSERMRRALPGSLRSEHEISQTVYSSGTEREKDEA